MIWREPTCHASNCYFCLSKKEGFGKGLRRKYANVQSVVFPVPHSSDRSHPVCPNAIIKSIQPVAETTTETSETEFEGEKPIVPITQKQLNDWVRDLELTKEKAEILASRMREQGFLDSNVRTTFFRNRDKPYAKFFEKKNGITFCRDILGLFQALKQHHDPEHWRLFIDSSKESLKAVLLHNGNKIPSVPIAHGVNVKETYETMKDLLQLIKYEEYKWKICCDLKVVAMLRGMQGGYTKYCCFYASGTVVIQKNITGSSNGRSERPL